MTPYYDRDGTSVFAGRLEDVLPTLPEASVDAVVCDPPYELGFMGKAWDSSGVAYQPATWGHVLRVLKPGGHLLAFGGTRTYHRMAVAIEDAGFEIRDEIMWLYAQGFPKSLDVSKAIDKAAGAEREVVGDKLDRPGYHLNGHEGHGKFGRGIGRTTAETRAKAAELTAPATDEAREWSGWGTALKPAHEPIVVARKPLTSTVAGNVLEWGAGALNIDGCRIEGVPPSVPQPKFSNGRDDLPGHSDGPNGEMSEASGRWPANVVLDPEAATALDRQSGERSSQGGAAFHGSGYEGGWNDPTKLADRRELGYGDTGGASRFFYCAKASKADRGAGNTHPTVKPVELMRWLVRLVTPPGGTVLDPFAGSGSTLIAATIEGFRSIGIEPEPDHLDIIRHRLTQPIAPVLDFDGGAA